MGDAIANVYQIANVINDAVETVSDFKNHGFTRVGFLKAAQVAVGVAQIVTEPLPGPDSIADAGRDASQPDDQQRGGAPRHRAIAAPIFGERMRSSTQPWCCRRKAPTKYPQETIKATDGGEEAHPMGPLVFALVFESPEALGKPIALHPGGRGHGPRRPCTHRQEVGRGQDGQPDGASRWT